MSNRKLVLAAVALILGVVASAAWYVVGEQAARRAQIEERRVPALENDSRGVSLPASSLRGALRNLAAQPCPCTDAG